MKTRFQRLSFAVGLSLIVGAAAGKISQKEYCIYDGDKFGCNYFGKEGIRSGEVLKITEYNTTFAIATSFAVFGLCLMINAFVKEESNKAE
jgi:hypothetical protein